MTPAGLSGYTAVDCTATDLVSVQWQLNVLPWCCGAHWREYALRRSAAEEGGGSCVSDWN